MPEHQIDEVGYWTEIKLSIIREYAKAYATVLNKQPAIKHFAYIDAFAGAGTHRSRTTGEEIEGSPAIALGVRPRFSHYHLIDLDGQRAERLRQMGAGQSDVTVYEGDGNEVLLEKVLPACRYEDYRRALCLLDPYDLNPKWEVIRTAGQMKSVEVFLNFMIMDANMNILWKDPDKVAKGQVERMNQFWGDESWRQIAYRKKAGLFGDIREKAPNMDIAEAYRDRLKTWAGFKYVPNPLPMRNTKGAVIYYLFFASHNKIGNKIARSIFDKYRQRG